MKLKRLALLTFCLLSIVGIQAALAAGSGGFRVETPDAGASGKGSAFVGEANTPAAVFYNPAGLNQIKGLQISAGGSFITPNVDYKDNSGNETQMRRNTFFVPHVYAAIPLNDKLSLGFGSSSYWGLGTEWAEDSFSKYVATQSEITNLDTMLAASYKVTDQWSLAVSADNDDSKVSLKKNLNNFISPDARVQLKAKDNAWGFRLATMFKINDQNQVGFMYRSPVSHKYTGKIYIDGLDPVVYGPGGIAGLSGAAFPGTSYEGRATEKLTLPQSIVMGYSFKPNSRWTFNFDLEWMNWSKYKHDLIGYPDETDPGRLALLNTGNPTARNWHSAFSEAFGAEFAATDCLRLRAGYYHHGQVVPQGTFQSNLPDAPSHGITTGLGYDFSQHLTLDLAYSGLIYEKRKVNNDVGSLVGADIDGKYKQFTNVLFGTATYKF